MGFETRVVAKLRSEAAPRAIFGWRSWGWVMSGAAALAVAAFFSIQLYRGETERIAAMLGIGQFNHINCALGDHYPDTPPSNETMAEELGPDYRSLLPAVAEQARQQGLTIREAHHCEWSGRRFTHLILKSEKRLVSVILTKKREGEAFPRFEILAKMKADGLPVYTASEPRFEIAGYESGSHLAYVASNLPAADNLRMLAQLTPAIRQVR